MYTTKHLPPRISLPPAPEGDLQTRLNTLDKMYRDLAGIAGRYSETLRTIRRDPALSAELRAVIDEALK